jgi:probable rRNA maturation factor
MSSSLPELLRMQIRVLNRQRKYPTPANDLSTFSQRLAPLVLKVAREELPEQVLVVLVSDRKIAAIHEQFMGIAGPTDVITFQHGEIVVSVETAAKQASEYETNLLHELRLYLTHGLLHLAGYDDHSEKGFREMSKLQNELVAQIVKAAR